MVGYVIGSLAVDLETSFDWRSAFAVQGFWMLIIGVTFAFCPNDKVDIMAAGVRSSPRS